MSERQREAGADTLWSISEAIDSALRVFVDRQPLAEFYNLVRYQLGWEAERRGPLRPRSVLCAAACQACGGNIEQALPMAMAVALLHGFELNQEDLERSRQARHGRQSVWRLWGTPQAMNAGDGMHALAKMALFEGRGRLSAAAILHLEQELDQCCLRCCEAIHLEQAGRHQPPSPELPASQSPAGGPAQGASRGLPQEVLELAAAKGAVLFGYAAYAGCYLARAADSAQARELRRFGELLGSAAAVRALAPERGEAFGMEALAALEASGIAASHCATLRSLADYVLNRES
jgi:geranylgeranyl pyrophosphate synthase